MGKSSGGGGGRSSSSNATNKGPGKFLRALRLITQQSPADVARWSADGLQFDVVNPDEFTHVLLQHFPNAQPKTFFRQLSHYGISKVNQAHGGGGYSKMPGCFSLRHVNFTRDEPNKMFDIQCRNRKKLAEAEPKRRSSSSAKRKPTPRTTAAAAGSAAAAASKADTDEDEDDDVNVDETSTRRHGRISVDELCSLLVLELAVAKFRRALVEADKALSKLLADERSKALLLHAAATATATANE